MATERPSPIRHPRSPEAARVHRPVPKWGMTPQLAMVLGNGAKLAVIGIVVGAIGGFFLTRFMSSFLFGVSPSDPLTFASISVVLSFVALLASYIPARRAMKVDPITALRYE